jgi:hypothetical protein
MATSLRTLPWSVAECILLVVIAAAVSWIAIGSDGGGGGGGDHTLPLHFRFFLSAGFVGCLRVEHYHNSTSDASFLVCLWTTISGWR